MTRSADGSSTVLVVCRANETRSPLYAAALRAALARRSAPWTVLSAGTLAAVDRPARRDVQRVAGQLGLSLADHRSRRITAELVAAAGLVVTAERDHRDTIGQLVPDAAARTFTAPELAALLTEVWPPDRPPGSPAQVAAAAHAARPRSRTAVTDLADPTGRGRDAHRQLAAEVEQLVPPVADALGGPAGVGTSGPPREVDWSSQ